MSERAHLFKHDDDDAAIEIEEQTHDHASGPVRRYAAFARSGQEATLAVVDAWSRSFRDAAVKLPAVTAQAASREAID